MNKNNEKTNIKTNIIIKIFEIKSKLKKIYSSYEKENDDLIKILNEELKKNLIAYFKKKGK
jgi:hypothetical protein